MKIYHQLATSFQAWKNCIASKNQEWEDKHFDKIQEIIRNEMPSGSGFDNGTFFDFEMSSPENLTGYAGTSYEYQHPTGF